MIHITEIHYINVSYIYIQSLVCRFPKKFKGLICVSTTKAAKPCYCFALLDMLLSLMSTELLMDTIATCYITKRIDKTLKCPFKYLYTYLSYHCDLSSITLTTQVKNSTSALHVR